MQIMGGSAEAPDPAGSAAYHVKTCVVISPDYWLLQTGPATESGDPAHSWDFGSAVCHSLSPKCLLFQAEVGAQFQRLIRVVPLHVLSMPEFEVYIRALQQKQSGRQSRQKQSRREALVEQVGHFAQSFSPAVYSKWLVVISKFCGGHISALLLKRRRNPGASCKGHMRLLCCRCWCTLLKSKLYNVNP